MIIQPQQQQFGFWSLFIPAAVGVFSSLWGSHSAKSQMDKAYQMQIQQEQFQKQQQQDLLNAVLPIALIMVGAIVVSKA